MTWQPIETAPRDGTAFLSKPNEGVCTIHQLMSGWDGFPLYKGSEIRVPGGEAIPRAELVSLGPSAGNHHWEAVIRIPIAFGEGIKANAPTINEGVWVDGGGYQQILPEDPR